MSVHIIKEFQQHLAQITIRKTEDGAEISLGFMEACGSAAFVALADAAARIATSMLSGCESPKNCSCCTCMYRSSSLQSQRSDAAPRTEA